MNDEFLNAIEKSELSKNTITTYTANYKRLMGLLNDEPILCFTEARLIKRLKELKDIPPMSINGMVSIVMLIRRHNHMPTAKIEKYKLVLSKDHYRDKNINNKELKNKLVSIEDLYEHIQQALKNEDYTTYIINYLMVKYGLRNLDLNLEIVKDKSIMKDDKTTNYIYFTKKYVMFIIQTYKTRSVYGIKSLRIEDKDFINVCKILLTDTDRFKLIESSNNNKFIQERTLNNMGEGLVFKSVLHQLSNDGDIETIKRLSLSRGTSLSVIFEDYHIEG